MAFVAPWLMANNPLDFMRQGAALGLQLRAQRAAEDQALARNELAQQELAQRRELEAARAAETLRQHNALEAYRKEQTALGERRLDAQERRQAAADALRFGTQVSASNFFKDLRQDASVPGFDYDEGNPYERLQANPLAINHPAVRQQLSMWEQGQRSTPFNPEVREIEPGVKVVRLGPNHWQYLGRTMTEGELPPGVRRQLYADQIKETQAAIDVARGTEKDALKKALKALQAKRNAMLEPPAQSFTKRYRYDTSSGKVVEVQ